MEINTYILYWNKIRVNHYYVGCPVKHEHRFKWQTEPVPNPPPFIVIYTNLPRDDSINLSYYN